MVDISTGNVTSLTSSELADIFISLAVTYSGLDSLVY